MIPAEERAKWRERLKSPYSCHSVEHATFTLRLLDDLEETSRQLETALNVNAVTQIEAAQKLFVALAAGVSGDTESAQISAKIYSCPHCNKMMDTAGEATAHDAVCDKHPGNIRASAAEAEARTLSKMVDWLAHQAWRKGRCDYLPPLKERGGIYCHECPYTFDCSICWRKAASLAVRP